MLMHKYAKYFKSVSDVLLIVDADAYKADPMATYKKWSEKVAHYYTKNPDISVSDILEFMDETSVFGRRIFESEWDKIELFVKDYKKKVVNEDKTDRKKMLLAMEFICRHINNEDVFMGWLSHGVADGDIEYGCFDTSVIDDDDCILENEEFKELMACFLRRMELTAKSGGLYCDGIVADKND